MELSSDDIRKVAVLAKLQFVDGDIDNITDTMRRILTFVEQLSEVDTEGVDEMAHPLELNTVLRADEQRPSLDRAAALSNAPVSDDEYFLVPPVLGRGG